LYAFFLSIPQTRLRLLAHFILIFIHYSNLSIILCQLPPHWLNLLLFFDHALLDITVVNFKLYLHCLMNVDEQQQDLSLRYVSQLSYGRHFDPKLCFSLILLQL
jgi:hypothetical protein